MSALFTSTQQKLLQLFFNHPERSYFATEIFGLAAAGRGAVQRELARLTQAGLVLRELRGRQAFYRANPQSPVYEELRNLVQKTMGVDLVLKAALEPLRDQIKLAFIYGSVAKKTANAGSDVDLLVVSDKLSFEELMAAIAPAQKQLGRVVNFNIYGLAEIRQRWREKNSFLKKVVAGPTLEIYGATDEFFP